MPASNLRILVVEDHEFQRQLFARLLRTLGATTVHEAGDGEAALAIIADPFRPVDVVITDLDMPGMDGIELIRRLGEAGSRASLILASAVPRDLLDSVANIARAYDIELLGVIRKPATVVTLTPLLERHRARQPEAGSESARLTVNEVVQAVASGEFEPWFEPEVDLLTGLARGMRAVARWRHPTKGLLDAPAFMELVQTSGQRDALAWLMLRKSAEQCRRWNDRGQQLVVSVNLAFETLTTPDLATRIHQVAQKAGLDPRFMLLGVTEAALKTELAKALENLARLRIIGFGLGIDEFGSGKMAVEQLSLVAFTELGIASTFVSGVDIDDTARVGLAASLEFAQQLKLKAIASGISSKHEWNLLYEWGCYGGRGPFISAPLASDDVPDWLAKWQAQRRPVKGA